MFKFDHSNYKESDKKVILPPGECSFYIKKCEQTTSEKSGAPMLKLELSIENASKQKGYVFDYILAQDNFLWKIKHLCEAIGHPEKFEANELHAEFFNNKTGKCIIKVEDSGEYGKQNKIKDYVGSKSPSKPKAATEADNFVDDDLPF